MNKKPSQKKNPIYLFLLILPVAGIAIVYFLVYGIPRVQREDYRQLSSQKYDTVFFSMYPIDTYREEDFSYYRGMSLFKASYCIPRFSVLEQYMKRAASSGNIITTAYLGIRPEMTTPEELQALINRYPGVTFEIIFPCPSADYWTGLSQEEYGQILNAYGDFLTAAPGITNAGFYFMSSLEWLISNPDNYENEWLVTDAIATTIMTHCDRSHDYLVTEQNAPFLISSLNEVTEKVRQDPDVFPDLSDVCVLFFGDSVIGNYNNSLSIPGVVAGLTGATVFNCGYGGNTASMPASDSVALPSILDAFFAEDPDSLPEETQVYEGVSSYLSTPATGKKLCFIIYYGLNDYFSSCPLYSEEPYDTSTYCGALRTAVETIRANAPDAQIILCSPNFVGIFDNGTEPHGSLGSTLSDYAEAVVTLSQELGTDVLDTFHELGINHENQGEYLEDQVHPNAACRYLIGKIICRLIR